MAIEASIVEQLQELRRWQIQQQQELIKQQKEQREILTNEQNRMYQALSLSVDEISLSEQSLTDFANENQNEQDLIDLDTPDEECETPTPCSFPKYLTTSNEKNNNFSSNIKVPRLQLDIRNAKTDSAPKVDYNDSYNQHDYSSELSIGSMQSSHTRISIDEIPVPSPRKDFNTLLEERLRDSEVLNENENNNKPVIKRPFLRKGQGLARFMPGSNPVKKISKNSARPRSASFSSSTQASNAKVTKPVNLQRCNTIPKSRKSVTNPPPVARKLALKNVPPPRKKPRSKSISSLPGSAEKKKPSEIASDSTTSDLEVKSKRELEEVRIFELLEDKAENSSFCSTSSTVIAFLQQSTPLKHKALLHSASKQKLSLTDIGDQTLEELVRTTKANHLPPLIKPLKSEEKKITNWDDVPISQLKNNRTAIGKPEEKQIVNWDEVPISKLKNDRTVTGTVLPYGTDIDMTYEDDNQESSRDDNNVSLHVRFSEYNEYKTMTDTSSTSSDSQTTINYVNDKGAWSDCSATPDSSDVENIPSMHSKNVKVNEKQEFSKSSEDDSDEDETVDYKNEPDDEDDEDDDEEDEEVETKNETLLKDETVIDEKNDSAAIFKSELLKTRLLELEREIEIFRKESAALTLQRQKLQEERTKLQEERLSLQRSYDEKEKTLEMEKKKNESVLQEEKKRLAREKAALESRLKDAWEKAQKSKQERQEIEKLREELDELKDVFSQKESKWSATNARQRSQMRVLQTENSKLKQEIEKLQQKKNARLKKPITPTNTRAIHQINKFLADRKKISPFKNESTEEVVKLSPDVEEAYYEVEMEPAEEKPVENKIEKVKMVKTAESIARTRNLYESLLKDATECLSDPQIRKRNSLNQQDIDNENQEEDDQKEENNEIEEKNENQQTDSNTNLKANRNKQGIREVHHPDGRIEYWYPNGNVKKIFPDRCLTKMIYYNGDVRETDKNGTVKYFYASTRTWHTTMPDGLEILEFPDGQVERRSKDGTIEVSFPDGSVRIVQADGSEKWALKDGTIAETSADGEKILTLPNGQREIHTKEHKRREYPDGTVKLVYPDGIQETRYANGRVRLKDKDGNLIMDSHQ